MSIEKPSSTKNTVWISSDYNVKIKDDVINVDTTGGAVTLRLPNIKNSGFLSYPKTYCINDVGGAAGTNPITVVGLNGDLVNGGASTVIQKDFGSGFADVCNTNEWLVSKDTDSATSGIGGGGMTNFIPKFTSTTTIGNSTMYQADTGVAIGTTTPAASALFQLDSTTQGFLPPRMDTTERDAITPVAGLTIYNTDSNCVEFWNGSAWTCPVNTTLYDGNSVVGSNRVATVTDTLTWTGGTTISTLTSGSSTITAGTGSNPIGFGSFGDLSLLNMAGGFDHFGGSYAFGSYPFWQSQIYNDATFVEQAGHFVGVANFSGTDRPYAGISYTAPDTSTSGFEANIFGERLLSQASGLNYINPIDVSAGMAFLSGSGGTGYLGATNQAGFVSWMNAGIPTGWGGIYTGDGSIAGNRTVTGDENLILFTNTNFQALSGDGAYIEVSFDEVNLSGAQIAMEGNTYINADLFLAEDATTNQQLVFRDLGATAFDGTLTNDDLTAARTWQLPDASGTIALTSDLPPPITDDRIPRGDGTSIEDGTWVNAGNDIYPVTTGSNIGQAANRIDTIFMASTIDFASNFTLNDGTNNIWQATSAGIIHNPDSLPTVDYVWRSDTNANAMTFDSTGAGNIIINGATALGSGFTFYGNGGFGAVFQGNSQSASEYVAQYRDSTNATLSTFRNSGRVDLAVNGAPVNVGNINSSFQLNVNNNLRVQNDTGNAEIEITATTGQAFLQINNTQANLDSYIHFANAGVNEISIGWDESQGYWRQGTSAITTNVWYEYNPANNQARHAAQLGVGTAFSGNTRRFNVRGLGNDSSTISGEFQRLNGTSIARFRDDGLSGFNTTLSQLSGIGGAYQVRNMISDWTSTSSGAELEWGIGHRTTFNPTVDSTVRGGAGRITALKQGAFKVRETTGLYAEVLQLGSANYDQNAIDGLYGLQAAVRNQYANDITINQMWSIKTNTTNSTATGGQTATVTDYGGIDIAFDAQTNLTATNMYGIRIQDPVNNTGAVITNSYDLFAQTNTLATDSYGVYIQGSTKRNWFNGAVSIGGFISVATTQFQLRADASATTIARMENSSGLDKFILNTDGQTGLNAGSGASILGNSGHYWQSTNYSTGFSIYGRNGTSRTVLIQHTGTTVASPIALDVGFQGAQSGTVTSIRGVNFATGGTTHIGTQGNARNGSLFSIGVDGVNAGGESTAPAVYRAAVRGVSASNLNATSYGGYFGAQWNNAGVVYTSTYTGVEGFVLGTAGNAASTGDLVGGSFRVSGNVGTGDSIALRVPSTGNIGTIVFGSDNPSVNASFVEVYGDLEIIGASNRLIMEDNNGSGDRYECYINNGTWTTNLLP